jgi:hypothetical protein
VLPLWKIRREWTRLLQQSKGIVEAFTDPVKQRQLDRLVAAGLPYREGLVPESKKVALFLVYQPTGISASTRETCAWLAAAGYAPFVVSNAKISPQDADLLLRVTWRIVERPNFGYDFGGYRDGLTCLETWAIDADEVLVLNDSVWVPVLPESDLLTRLSDHSADIAGAILRKRGDVEFLESYLYRFNRKTLTHPSFRAYWAGLRLTSNKYHVIRRGERGFSHAMQQAGLHLAEVYDNAGLAARIAQQDDSFLEVMLKHAAYIDAPLATERDQLLRVRGHDWRAKVLAHVNRALVKRLGYSTFPYAMVHLTGYPFLKKSREPISKSWRLAHIAAVDASDLPSPSATALGEIRARDARV